MSIHEQARAEAEKRYPVSAGAKVLHSDRQITFIDGFLAGHEAATRTRVVSTVTELDALPVGSVVMSGDGQVWKMLSAPLVHVRVGRERVAASRPGRLRDCLDEDGTNGLYESRTVLYQTTEPTARVLYDPEETR